MRTSHKELITVSGHTLNINFFFFLLQPLLREVRSLLQDLTANVKVKAKPSFA